MVRGSHFVIEYVLEEKASSSLVLGSVLIQL